VTLENLPYKERDHDPRSRFNVYSQNLAPSRRRQDMFSAERRKAACEGRKACRRKVPSRNGRCPYYYTQDLSVCYTVRFAAACECGRSLELSRHCDVTSTLYLFPWSPTSPPLAFLCPTPQIPVQPLAKSLPNSAQLKIWTLFRIDADVGIVQRAQAHEHAHRPQRQRGARTSAISSPCRFVSESVTLGSKSCTNLPLM
jgi:hypothetical protein